jgi:hypothetical protein
MKVNEQEETVDLRLVNKRKHMFKKKREKDTLRERTVFPTL